MNAPFQSVGIIFIVTIVHVVAIAVYSLRTIPESTFQRSIVIPTVESLEVMPEHLVRELSVPDAGEEPESCLEHLETGVGLESDVIAEPETLKEETDDVVKVEVPQLVDRETSEAETKEVVMGKVVETEVSQIIKAGHWEDSDFTKRVSYPHLDGILGKKSKKLAEREARPAPKSEVKSNASEPAPQSRSFSPFPRS